MVFLELNYFNINKLIKIEEIKLNNRKLIYILVYIYI